MTQRRRTGVFGGSFDPPHLGHVALARLALQSSQIDRLLIVPTYSHAFSKRMVGFEHRVKMCELAFVDLSRGTCLVSTIEEELSGTSYTIDTLALLRKEFPDDVFRLVVGGDIPEELHKWKCHEELQEIAPLLVIGRDGYSDGDLGVTVPNISSSGIRLERQRGRHEAVGLPESVREYIRKHGLYS